MLLRLTFYFSSPISTFDFSILSFLAFRSFSWENAHDAFLIFRSSDFSRFSNFQSIWIVYRFLLRGIWIRESWRTRCDNAIHWEAYLATCSKAIQNLEKPQPMIIPNGWGFSKQRLEALFWASLSPGVYMIFRAGKHSHYFPVRRCSEKQPHIKIASLSRPRIKTEHRSCSPHASGSACLISCSLPRK